MKHCGQIAPTAMLLIEFWDDALDKPFKIWNPDFYYGNLYIKC